MLTPPCLRSLLLLSLLPALGAVSCKIDKTGIAAGGVVRDAGPDSRDKRDSFPEASSLDLAGGDAGGSPETAPDVPPAGDDATADGGPDGIPLAEDAMVPLPDARGDLPPPSSAQRCDAPLSLPVAARRLLSAPRSDDIAFDRDGHFISFDQRSIVRMDRAGRTELLVANLIGTKGGALRALPGGEIFVADFEQSRLFVRDSAGQVRTLPAAVESPMKMIRGPAGGLYVTGKQGAVSRVNQANGAVTVVATTDFEVGGLTFSRDYTTLYVGAISNDTIQAFDVRPDGSLGPARLWKGQIPRAQALATDECGSVYVVSEGDGRIRRIKASGAVEILSDTSGLYAWSLAFGSGQQGWSAQSLYVHEATGRLFEIALPYTGQQAPPAAAVE
jgi:hypothetical protein